MRVRSSDTAVRNPVAAGIFYPNDAAALRDAINEAYLSPWGPGAVPQVQAGSRRLLGVMVPHAGYVYSGQGAAWGFTEVARDGRPAAAVLLGVNHHGVGAPIALSPASGWQTPLGTMPVAAEIGRRLLALDHNIAFDAQAHALEHSIEVQIPFLQALFGELFILPLVLGRLSLHEIAHLGHALATLASEFDLLFIASSDLSHYLSAREAEVLDRLALQQVAAVDPVGLIDTVQRHHISMCGVVPVAVMLTAVQVRGVVNAEILHYHTSGDVTGNHQEVVGYGTAIIHR